MQHLTFADVLEMGFDTVIVQSCGYDEGRVCPTYQPFKHKRDIVFKVHVFSNPIDGYLDHRTFFLKEDESKLDYILQDDGKVYVDAPVIGADIEY